MISVNKAEELILQQISDFGVERTDLQQSLGRVLAEPIAADRDFPPFNRATMDGIAIAYSRFAQGQKVFTIKNTLAAGQQPIDIDKPDQCIQIMTGAALPDSVDSVVPIEELIIEDNLVTITAPSLEKKQFVHPQGSDKRQGEIVINPGTIITSDSIPLLASVGASKVTVRKLPKVAIITTGDELADIETDPSQFMIRRSNDLAMWSVLQTFSIQTERIHVADKKEMIIKTIKKCLNKFDAILISGGVSKGKFDFVQEALEELAVIKIFHGIHQKPGKPMWFGVHPSGTRVFAFPGNPVSTYVCLFRYFLPWLKASLQIKQNKDIYAMLDQDVKANSRVTQFIPVMLYTTKKAQLRAKLLSHNGSGDFISLVSANAFVELPPQTSLFKKGESHKVLLFKNI